MFKKSGGEANAKDEGGEIVVEEELAANEEEGEVVGSPRPAQEHEGVDGSAALISFDRMIGTLLQDVKET